MHKLRKRSEKSFGGLKTNINYVDIWIKLLFCPYYHALVQSCRRSFSSEMTWNCLNILNLIVYQNGNHFHVRNKMSVHVQGQAATEKQHPISYNKQ